MKYRRAATSANYKPHDLAVGGVCFYCGATAGTKDHIPAVSVVQAVGADQFDELWLVPCCGECNNTLGDKWLNTISDRAMFLQKYYRQKYQAALSVKDWDEDELAALDGSNLGKQVRAGLAERDFIRARLENLVLVS